MGASRVVAAGRDSATLTNLKSAGGAHVIPAALSGNVESDIEALAEAGGERIDVALDLVGRANSSASTEAALRALRRGGRLAMMGSSSEPLRVGFYDMLANDWHVMGCFMYPKDALARLARLVEAGLLNIDALTVKRFPLKELELALRAATEMRDLDMTVLLMR